METFYSKNSECALRCLDIAIEALTRKYVRGLSMGGVSFTDFKALEALQMARSMLVPRQIAASRSAS